MRLPRIIGNKVTEYVDAEDFSHRQACFDYGLDPQDTDNPNELPLTLDICFPEHLEADGLRTYRTIDWAEIQATVWGPVRKKLKLCKVGWHSWSMGIHRHGFTMYRCSDCQKDTQYVPRWAR